MRLISDECEKAFQDAGDIYSLSPEWLSKQEATATSMVRNAPEKWNIRNMELAEEEFNIPYDDYFNLVGKIDGIARREDGTIWVRDYKTKGSFDNAFINDLLQRNVQGNIYCYAARKLGKEVQGFEVLMIRRPTIRQKKKEVLSRYIERIVSDYLSRTDFYYAESRCVIPNPNEMFQRNLGITMFRLRQCYDKNLWEENETSCHQFGSCCMYLPLCSRHVGAEDAFDMLGEDHHPELSNMKGEKDNGIGKRTK